MNTDTELQTLRGELAAWGADALNCHGAIRELLRLLPPDFRQNWPEAWHRARRCITNEPKSKDFYAYLLMILEHFDKATDHSTALTDPEIEEVINEGVANFQAASEGVDPFQQLVVGIRYSLAALRQHLEGGK